MRGLWLNLPAGVQDALFLVLFLLPAVAIGAGLLRGLAPFPLVTAILWRFRRANAMFVTLIAISLGWASASWLRSADCDPVPHRRRRSSTSL
jgi:putative ABC transport system permease protein